MGIKESQHEKIERLVRDLGSREATRRESAIALLTIMGHRAVEKLHEALGSPKLLLRRNSARVLARIGDPRSLEPLLTLLEDPDPKVRSVVIRNLSQFDAPAIVPRLIRAYEKTPDPEIQSHALTALHSPASRGDLKARAFVLGRILDRKENPRLRLQALSIFRDLPKKESRAVMVSLRKEGQKELMDQIEGLHDGAPGKAGRGEVKRIVSDLMASDYFSWHETLQKVHPGIKDLPDALMNAFFRQRADAPVFQRIEAALIKYGPEALDSVHRSLEKETRPENLEALLNLLRRFSDQRSVPFLTGCLKKLTLRKRRMRIPWPVSGCFI